MPVVTPLHKWVRSTSPTDQHRSPDKEAALEGVSWDDVDLTAGTVRVRGTRTRAADRTLSLSTELAARLEKRGTDWGRTGLVFGTTRFRGKRGQAREVGNVLSAAGLSWAGSHTFRRTVATWMGASGAPLAEIANQLGHADVNTTARYLQPPPGPDSRRKP